MPRYVIHIGPMKTGSTYLQQCFAGASDDLAAQGVCYPKELLSGNNGFSHTPVGIAVRRRQEQRLRAVFEKLNSGDNQTILLSSEQLSFLNGRQLAWLRDAIGVANIDVVYACRRWSDRIPSMWFQSLYRGAAHSLPEYYVKLLNGQAGRDDLDYSRLWSVLAEVFGREHVHIFPYSNFRDDKEDIFVRFCTDILRVPSIPKPPKLGETLWASFGVEETELLRILNGMYIMETGAQDTTLYWQYKRRRKRMDFTPVLETMVGYFTKMKLDDAATHMDPFFARMEVFTDRVVGGGSVFTRAAEDETYVDPAYLLEEGVAARLREVYATVRSTPGRIPEAE